MPLGDYFFLIFLAVIVATRLLLIRNVFDPFYIKKFRVRHYMYGVVLILLAFANNNLTMLAIGAGLFIDELPLILMKGLGHDDKEWRGDKDYHMEWTAVGVLLFVFLVYMFRKFIVRVI